MIMTQPVRRRMSWKLWAIFGLMGLVALPLAAENTNPQLPPATEDQPHESPKPPEVAQPLAAKEPANPQPKPADNLPTKLPKWENGETEHKSAVLKPFSDLRLSSLHSGTVSKIHMSEGDRVQKGQVILELKNTEIEIRYQEAQGELKAQQEKTKADEVAVRLAKSKLTSASQIHVRALEINKKLSGSISSREVQELEARVEQAKLNLEKAELDANSSNRVLASLEKRVALAARLIEELSIRAPIDGIVLELHPKVGELARANDPIARIVQLDSLIAESYVSAPSGLLEKTVGVSVNFSQGIYQQFPAKVTFVSPIADPISGEIKIRCRFANTGPDGEFLVRPGQTAFLIVPKDS